jgi:hypothetical protein
MKRPDMKTRQQTAKILSEELGETHYENAPDAMGMLDLTPQALGVEPDSIRVFLARTFNNTNVPSHTFNFRHTSRVQTPYEDRTPGLKARGGRPYLVLISSTTEKLARVAMAVIAGVFLLAPMIALMYIDVPKYRLITTCLFVLAFALMVSLASKASNQEVMASCAAYAAVLVVFAGQTSPTLVTTSNNIN